MVVEKDGLAVLDHIVEQNFVTEQRLEVLLRPAVLADRANAQLAVLAQIQRTRGHTSRVETRGKRIVECGTDIALLEHGLAEARQDGQLGGERGVSLREATVEHDLPLELADDTAITFAFERVEIITLGHGRRGRSRERLAEHLDDFPELRRTNHEIVRAGAPRQLAIGWLDIARRDEHERHRLQLWILAQRHREAKAIELRHHHVGHDDVRTLALDRRECLRAIRRRLDVEPEPTEPERRELELKRIVVDNEEPPAFAEALVSRHRRWQVRLDHREQPRRRDRLCDHVVEPDGRHARFVQLRDEPRKRDDRDVGQRQLAQLPDELEPIGIRQHQILQNDLRAFAHHELACTLPIGRFDDEVAMARQRGLHHAPRRRIVVDDHDGVTTHAVAAPCR